MKRTSIKDLAKLLSLNPSTISRALADHVDIKAETKSRVKAAAEEFKYFPNLHAKYFRQKQSGLIALVLPEFNMFFVPQLLDSINHVLDEANYSVIVFYSNNSLEKEKEIVNHCLSWVVDGVLISLSEKTENCDHLLPLKEAEIPLVLFDKVVSTDVFVTITIDDQLVAYEATTQLLLLGKKRILGVFGNPSLEITKKRQAGFLQAISDMKDALITGKIENVQVSSPQKELDLLFTSSDYDAVFTMSDELLLLTYSTMRRLGLYPDKTSLISISDGKLPYLLFPAISHILHSGYSIGEIAAKTLLKLRSKEPLMENHIQASTAWIQLDSF